MDKDGIISIHLPIKGCNNAINTSKTQVKKLHDFRYFLNENTIIGIIKTEIKQIKNSAY